MAGQRLVILGGGFGGLDVARAIGRSRAARAHWETVLVDKENFFQFNPLLPAVAVGAVETRHIVYPLRDMARHRHIRFMKNRARVIDLERRSVQLHNGLDLPFDRLVIAVGSVTNFYGIPGAEAHTRPFKTIVDAMYLRARVVELFEMAEQAESVEQRRRLLRFLIVGGGVTGVEVGAELLDMVRDTLLPRYPTLRPGDFSLVVLEGGDRLVATARAEHSRYAQRFLERRGAVVRLGARVAHVEPKAVVLTNGERLEAFTMVWTAGVRPPNVVQALPLLRHRDGRIRVDDHLRALDPDGRALEHVAVIGDCAAFDSGHGTMVPQLSQSAVKMGAYAGQRLVAIAEGRQVPPFHFDNQGYVISLGKHSSAVEAFGFATVGKLAWLMWAFIYLIKMVGVRKQIEVAIDHLTHFFFTHDSSQILNRRAVLADDELDLQLDAPDAASPAGGCPPVGEAGAGGIAPNEDRPALRGDTPPR